MLVEEILSQIASRVADQRQRGKYPPGLEQELEYEFSNLLSKLSGSSTSELASLTHLIIDRLAVIDHLAMMIVELENRIRQLEIKALIDDE